MFSLNPKRLIALVLIVLLPLVFIFSPKTYAATTPNLGLASTFGILSNTYTNTLVGTTINGDLGYTTGNGPALAPTVSGSTHVSDTTYNQAVIDQDAALTNLNGQGCTFNFAAATDLSTLAQPLAPGVYCITGAMSVVSGITLQSGGTYIFRSTGALNTTASTTIALGTASACDVFWTPGGAVTLGASSTFAGTVFDDTVITVGTSVAWTGRALSVNGTISTDSDTITVPTCVAPTATPTPTNTPTSTPTVTPIPPTATPTPTSLPTSTPTPTVISTPPPTSTPATQSTSEGGGSSSGNNSSAPSCTNSQPSGSPNLFQIDVSQTQAVLYFAPVQNADNYFISYGYASGDQRFGVALDGQSSGVLSYTLNSLSPNTDYYIQIRAGNGCMPGNWGNTMKITTTENGIIGGISYYKDFISQVLSFFPRDITVVNAAPTIQPQPETKSCLYTVQQGDSLWGIAQSKLGNGNRYPEIVQNNNLTSTIIHPGQILKVGCS